MIAWATSCHKGWRGRISARSSVTGVSWPVTWAVMEGIVVLAVVVVIAVVVIVLVGRDGGGGEPTTEVTAVDRHGLRLTADRAGGAPATAAADAPATAAGGATVPWDDIWEITVVTRREVRRMWFGFEIRAEGHGLLSIDGPAGPGEAFLAESHRFAGFDHEALGQALLQRGSRVVCYSR